MKALVMYDYPASPGGLTEQNLVVLTALVRLSKNPELDFGFNEWFRAQDGFACGEDWQLWSAGMCLYASKRVETGRTPLFGAVRGQRW